jgi:endoglucanase
MYDRRRILVLEMAILLGVTAPGLTAARAGEVKPGDSSRGPWIRVNQVGYLPDDPKIALLSSDQPLEGTFSVGDYQASVGSDQGAWGPFAHNYRLDFSPLKTPGRYRVRFGEVTSLEFAIGDDAYAKVPAALLQFMKLQRCGDNPITGRKCHQQDGRDTLTGEPVDVAGGWHDAADKLKHMITTSYCVAALFLAGTEASREEARYGAALVRKLHPSREVLYIQIGDDRDHLAPAIWHEDQADYGWGPGGPRTAWRALGHPQGPKYRNASTGLASLAGRCAAALALAGDLNAARALYQLARECPGAAMSIPVRAPYYYGESTFHDDLEWAATELYIATKEPEYLQQAITHADQAGAEPWMGRERHGHYEFFPYVNLAHWRLYSHADEAAKQRLAGYYRTGLERVRDRALRNPYRLGTPVVWCSTNDVIAFATEARLYERMTGDPQFRTLAAEARDWIFGRNPWGVSFVLGVPEGGVYASKPHHMFYKLINHLPVGGLVDGPVARDIHESLKYASFGEDPLARFQSDVAVYHNVFEDFSTNEPIIDGTVSLLLLLELWGH